MLTLSNTLKAHFGVSDFGMYYDDAIRAAETDLRDAIDTDGFTALIGPVGAGKTTMLNRVKTALSRGPRAPVFVTIRDKSERYITMASVLAAIIDDLAPNESIRRSREARWRQAERLIGERAMERPVSIVIEDAHRLHPATLSALKLLREFDWMGRSPLCSVVLVGWPELAARIDRKKEVAWRMSRVVLNEQHGHMTLPQRVAFLETRFGRAIDAETRAELALDATGPAELEHLAVNAMREAHLAGYDVVDARTVPPHNPVELKQAVGVSYADLSRESGIPKTTLIRQMKSGEISPELQATLDRVKSRTPSTAPAAPQPVALAS